MQTMKLYLESILLTKLMTFDLTLTLSRVIEIGHTFQFGLAYTSILSRSIAFMGRIFTKKTYQIIYEESSLKIVNGKKIFLIISR